MKSLFYFIIVSLGSIFIMSFNNIAKSETSDLPTTVTVVGAMKNVMWKGQLYGIINLDTISNKQHLYGFGPLEYLGGELLIIDGKSYRSTVLSDTKMKVEETYMNKAPFFAYAHVSEWEEIKMPDSINAISSLENFLNVTTAKHNSPFIFKLEGKINTATIHIVNLPKGTAIHSPNDAHKGQQVFDLINEQVSLIGFFSTEHKTIFTHHDTFLHIHLITDDRTKMGHLDDLEFNPNSLKLFIPKF